MIRIDGDLYTIEELTKIVVRYKKEAARNRAKSLRSYHKRKPAVKFDENPEMHEVEVAPNLTVKSEDATNLTVKSDDSDLPVKPYEVPPKNLPVKPDSDDSGYLPVKSEDRSRIPIPTQKQVRAYSHQAKQAVIDAYTEVRESTTRVVL